MQETEVPPMFPRENWLKMYLGSFASPFYFENSIIKGMKKMVIKTANQKSWFIKSKNELIPYPRRINGSSDTSLSFSGIGIAMSSRMASLRA